MPFIRGRYHINPIAGEALEAARAAEAALSELEQEADGALADPADAQGDEGGEDDDEFGGASHAGAGPVHREAAGTPGMRAIGGPSSPRLPGEGPSSAYAPRPETHVFAGHRDLVSFLRDEFAKDCKS